MDTNVVNNVISEISKIFETTNEVLSEWTTPGNLKFPSFMEMMANKMSLSKEQIKEYDPLIRHFIHRHPSYKFVRGMNGGIIRIKDYQERLNKSINKLSLKEKMKEELEKKLSKDNKSNLDQIVETSEVIFDEQE